MYALIVLSSRIIKNTCKHTSLKANKKLSLPLFLSLLEMKCLQLNCSTRRSDQLDSTGGHYPIASRCELYAIGVEPV